MKSVGSFSDISQISDIHNISRISRSNCSRIIGRIDSLHNLFDHQSSITHNASKSIISLSQGINHFEKTAKCFTLCEDSISEHAKCKIILDCIKDASLNNEKNLLENIAEKLRSLLLIHELNKYMHLPSVSKGTHEELSILGITDLPKYDLSYEEKLEIKCCVETILREKIHDFILRYESLGGNVKEVLRMTDCNVRKKLFEPHEIEMLQWRNKIDELCIQYEADVLKCKTLINKWNQLKYQDMNKIYLEKAEYLLLQAQVAEIQAKITKLSCIIKMFKETPVTIDAYQILNTAVNNKLFTIMNEIKQKEELKRQYDRLRNTEYDDILKTYLHFCKAIKKKKQILQKL